ncbi:Gfo/Idh/MocA family oxidoreductase [Chloroflexi bacterium TSY]|nr:Gfo/Idh/MocA family oxidoreductase [Chloroflexi bacterium TSY]
MTSKKYRVAVVGGVGTWGQFYLQAYATHPHCEEVILVDLARDRRQEFTAHYGIKTVYDTVEELLTHEVPDIVSVILPVIHIPDAVIACAEAGVKVISCEKPIAAGLDQADEMVRICRERGAILGCGTLLGNPHLQATAAWIGEGNIGKLTAAAIPFGIERELTGNGSVLLTILRLLTNREIEWVEGWTLPSEPGFRAEEATDLEADCSGYGRLGLSGCIICEIPKPQTGQGFSGYKVSVTGEAGQIYFFSGAKPILIQGNGARSFPVFPKFLNPPPPILRFSFAPVIEPLMRAHDTGKPVWPSGHDFRQALEIAIALKQSAHRNHERVHLPLEDRTLKLYPHPYRLKGGDVFGWGTGFGGAHPPNLDEHTAHFAQVMNSSKEIS